MQFTVFEQRCDYLEFASHKNEIIPVECKFRLGQNHLCIAANMTKQSVKALAKLMEELSLVSSQIMTPQSLLNRLRLVLLCCSAVIQGEGKQLKFSGRVEDSSLMVRLSESNTKGR